MKAENLVIGQKVKYGYHGKYTTRNIWTVMSVDLQDKRFCYIKNDETGKLKRITINRLQPLNISRR